MSKFVVVTVNFLCLTLVRHVVFPAIELNDAVHWIGTVCGFAVLLLGFFFFNVF
jgi:hypothetical protein